MSVHPLGDGATWDEDVDVNQPHGLDYRYTNHVAKGVRLRMEKGHQAFGDATAGGEHIPGGAGVLGWGDGTPVVDGTFKGRGLVYDGTSTLWCSTDTAEATTCDFSIMLLNPNLQWGGGDVTWAGAQQFDGSVDMTILSCDGTADFTSLGVDGTAYLADVSISGWLGVDGTCDISSVNIDGSAEIGGDAVLADVSLSGALYVDSSVDVSGNVNVSGDLSVVGALYVDSSTDISGNTVITGELSVSSNFACDNIDSTSVKFGGTEGIGLYYDPTVYLGGETSTLGNGLIIKAGKVAKPGNDTDISFSTAFPTGVVSAVASINDPAGGGTISNVANIDDLVSTGFSIRNNSAAVDNFYWIAIGY